MHQNDAEAMQQNATQLNLILIPWNRISITTLSSIISKHSTQTILPHPHHTLSPSPKQVQETHEPRDFSILLLPVELPQTRFLNQHKQIFCTLIKPQHFKQTALGVYLQPTFAAPLQLETYQESSGTSAVELSCTNNQRLKAAGYFRRRTLSWIFDKTLNATLPNNLIIARRSPRKSFLPMGLSKEILDSPCLVIFLITVIPNTKAKRRNLGLID